jgi:hypothetical protein
MAKKVKKQDLSDDTKLILVLLFLFVLYPVGAILMWVWMDWPKWLKVLIALPIFIFAFFIALAILVGIVASFIGIFSAFGI